MDSASKRFTNVEDQAGQHRLNAIAKLSPALRDAYIQGLYGDLESRAPLSDEVKAIVAVAAILALGLSEAALAAQVEAALNRGLPLKKLELVVTQSVTYLGFHRIIDGMTAVQAVAAQRGLAGESRESLDSDRSAAARYRRGTEIYAELIDDGERMIREPFEAIAPDLAGTTFQIFGDVYAREGLSLRERQIATVATLAALDNGGRQLRLHIGTALNVGVTQEEIVEIMMLLQAHAGMPAAYNGMLAAREVFAEIGQHKRVYDET